MIENPDIPKRYSVVTIGGGAGGLSVAARLKKLDADLDIAVIDPSGYHSYQPAWTPVEGGQFGIARTYRTMRECLPPGVELIPGPVAKFAPGQNTVMLEGGPSVGYKYLVVAAGIQHDLDAIERLQQTLGRNGATSNYRFDLAPYTWQCIREFRSGTALFTQPPMPIKCAGGHQKILYLAADQFRKRKVAADIRFFTPGPSMFGVPFYAEALDKVVAGYGAKPCFAHRVVTVNGDEKTAFFEVVSADGNKAIEEAKFELLHAAPPQSAPRFIRESPFANAAGWLEVHRDSLRHVRYPNIFGIGDRTSTPNTKTAPAVKNQMPVAAANLIQALSGQGKTLAYDGYTSCPLTTSAGEGMLAEFCYDGVVTPSFPMNPRLPRGFYWWLKKSFLPWLNWNIVMKGKRWPPTHKCRDFLDAVSAIRP